MALCESLSIFIPKGDEPEDDISSGAARDPEDTRMLSMKNSDNKIMCGVMAFACRKVMTADPCSVQRVVHS